MYEPPPFAVNATGRKRWSVLSECEVAEIRIIVNFGIPLFAVTAIEAPAWVCAGAALTVGRTAGLLSGANR